MLRLETAGYRDRAMVAINARLQAGSTNTYRAVWAYEFALFGGVMAWYTGGDLPFIFQNVDMISNMVNGDEATAQRLADQASATVYNFMVNGDPSTADLSWSAYTVDNCETMVFCANSEVRNGVDNQVIALLALQG